MRLTRTDCPPLRTALRSVIVVPMRITFGRLATSIVLLFVLAPLSPAMAWHCGDHGEHAQMPDGGDCPDQGVQRCAGLWSAACCEFSSPARPTKDVPGGFDHFHSAPAVLSTPANALRQPLRLQPLLDLLVEDRAGPLPPRLLSSVLLI